MERKLEKRSLSLGQKLDDVETETRRRSDGNLVSVGHDYDSWCRSCDSWCREGAAVGVIAVSTTDVALLTGRINVV